ncbi:MAG: hypothetical protein EPN21_02170 [Methylococcaceae bacterium]|nr:MAG: hypothetical protein EPN21_02170 [Methylococcaceae bacterium]
MCIEPLAAHHIRADFDCGESALNEFLCKQAGQQQRRGLSKTYTPSWWMPSMKKPKPFIVAWVLPLAMTILYACICRWLR